MNKKSITLLYIFGFILSALSLEIGYLSYTKGMSDRAKEKKILFVKISTLPDLAIATEDYSTRHRSLSNIFSIYSDDGSLREYTSSSYTISHSHIYNNGKDIDEK
ncbi:MAG: hypothetical protein U9P38_02625 [Campylobacterota bacterium]|nr:hypothetical protein [Campylobacterota bacterium]